MDKIPTIHKYLGLVKEGRGFIFHQATSSQTMQGIVSRVLLFLSKIFKELATTKECETWISWFYIYFHFIVGFFQVVITYLKLRFFVIEKKQSENEKNTFTREMVEQEICPPSTPPFLKMFDRSPLLPLEERSWSSKRCVFIQVETSDGSKDWWVNSIISYASLLAHCGSG